MEKLMVPTVHMNGTSKQNLLAELSVAIHSIDLAMTALGEVTVHGRDFYPQGDHAINQALAQKRKQYNQLLDVMKELEYIALAIDEQGN